MADSKRWDLCLSHQDKGGKWRSTKVGVIFEGREGRLNIRIDPGVSISTPEGVLLTGYPPKERDDAPRGGRGGGGYSGGGGSYGGGPGATVDDDDSIPF